MKSYTWEHGKVKRKAKKENRCVEYNPSKGWRVGRKKRSKK